MKRMFALLMVVGLLALSSASCTSTTKKEVYRKADHFFAGRLTEEKLVGVPMRITTALKKGKDSELRFGEDGKLYCRTCVADEWRINDNNEIEFYAGKDRTAIYEYSETEDALVTRYYYSNKLGKLKITLDKDASPEKKIEGPNIFD